MTAFRVAGLGIPTVDILTHVEKIPAAAGNERASSRLLAVAGEVLEKSVTIQRAGGWFHTLDTPAGKVANRILDQGWEHHFCLVYGDTLTGFTAFSKLSAIPLEVL